MQRNLKVRILLTGALFFLSALFLVVLKVVDVQPIGPGQSSVGLATLNGFFFRTFGESPLWRTFTDIFSAAAILIAAGFALMGLSQLIRRRSIRKVDPGLLAMGGFYALVFGAYASFEVFVVNYRPVLLEGVLEPSFPSSHVLLVFCILSAAAWYLHTVVKNRAVRVAVDAAAVAVIILTVVGRALSGVHWFTDIFGALLIGGAFVMAYSSALCFLSGRTEGF